MMENNPENRKQGQLLTGAIIIGLGVIFLLDNLDIVSIHHWFFFWPAVLIGLGIVKVVQSRALGGYLVGAGLIFVGVVLFFGKLGLFHFTMKLFWPLVLIFFGFMILKKSDSRYHLRYQLRRQRRRDRKHRWSWEPFERTAADSNVGNPGNPAGGAGETFVPEKKGGVSLDKDSGGFSRDHAAADAKSSRQSGQHGTDSSPGDDEGLLDITAVMGGYQRSVRTSHFRGGEINAIMGGCELDLRECSINGTAEIQVFVVFGGISIRVPPDWLVVLQGNPILGGFDEQTASPPNHAKRLIVKGYAIMGGVEIRN